MQKNYNLDLIEIIRILDERDKNISNLELVKTFGIFVLTESSYKILTG